MRSPPQLGAAPARCRPISWPNIFSACRSRGFRHVSCWKYSNQL
jgi:hypothetical protein